MEKPLRRVAVSRNNHCFQFLFRANQLQAILFADIFLAALASFCQARGKLFQKYLRLLKY